MSGRGRYQRGRGAAAAASASSRRAAKSSTRVADNLSSRGAASSRPPVRLRARRNRRDRKDEPLEDPFSNPGLPELGKDPDHQWEVIPQRAHSPEVGRAESSDRSPIGPPRKTIQRPKVSRTRIGTTGSEGPTRKRTKPGPTGGVTRSEVWDYFTRIDNKPCECMDCNAVVNSHTGTMRYHAQTHGHHFGTPSARDRQVATIRYADKAVLDEKLLKWFINSFIPFRTSSDPYFIDFTSSARAGYYPMGRHAVSKTIIDMFDKQREDLREKLAQNDSDVAVTLDYWSSPNKLAFLTMTVTWVDANFFLHNGVQDFVQVPHPHTGDATFQVMTQTFKYFKIENRIIAITTDNASNLKSAMDLLRIEYPNIFHVPCAAHVLHLTVKAGIDELKTTIDKIRAVSKRAGREAAFQRFKKIQLEINTDQTPILIPIDVDTRWNSTHSMLSTAFALKEAVDQFTESENLSTLNEYEWTEIQKFVEFLEKFDTATNELFSHQSATFPLAFKVTHEINRHLEENEDNEHIEIEQAAKAMRLKFEKHRDRMGGIESRLAVTLDPRFKARMFQRDQEDMDEVTEKANKFLERVKNVRTSAAPKKPKLLSQMALERPKDDLPSTSGSNEELDEYLAEAAVPAHTKPLDWWKRNHTRFPKLAIVARSLFAVNPTATASEQVNSLGRQLIPYTRTRLQANAFRASVFLKSWMRVSELPPLDIRDADDLGGEVDEDVEMNMENLFEPF